MKLHFLKVSFSAFVLCSLFYVLSVPAFAQQEFTVDYNTTYTVDIDGSADVLNRITLTNNLSEVYATLYTLALEGKKPENIFATQDGKDLPSTVVESGGETKISASFPDSLVGKGRSRTFEIGYKQYGVALQNGQVWDLTLPKIGQPENMSSYKLLLKVPLLFGNPAYISPDSRSRNRSANYYEFSFDKDNLMRGVTAAFGEFQVFSFKLTYHLTNPYSQTGETEIALPPDTAFQRVYYESITPKPQKIRLDNDGNWLGTFRLTGGEELEVQAWGVVQIFATPQQQFPQISPRQTLALLAEQPFWEVSNPEVKKLANELRTPRQIFNYVTQTLNYDYSRVEGEAKRLGAVGALKAPDSALCMEFTDLFVALARATGISAREVNGYAYTENPELQPLSLVADVLHAWPEFWDEEKSIWRPIDPTWENTTGGIDYFNKFDLSHITFAIHGQSSTSPAAAGTYKTDPSAGRDVEIKFGQLPNTRMAGINITVVPQQNPLSVLQDEITVRLSNSGPTAFYAQPITFEPEGLEIVRSERINVDFLAPYDQMSFKVTFKSGMLSARDEKMIKINVGDGSFTYIVPQARFYTRIVLVVFVALLVFLAALFTALRHGKQKN
ncbi:MAG: transglutaminase domain-containing protein [Candidatus Blackburnbacteria bacterium]|nr:transglutaminase domain-containing protein [Candidatus Blackburnbacteria bacterium]